MPDAIERHRRDDILSSIKNLSAEWLQEPPDKEIERVLLGEEIATCWGCVSISNEVTCKVLGCNGCAKYATCNTAVLDYSTSLCV